MTQRIFLGLCLVAFGCDGAIRLPSEISVRADPAAVRVGDLTVIRGTAIADRTDSVVRLAPLDPTLLRPVDTDGPYTFTLETGIFSGPFQGAYECLRQGTGLVEARMEDAVAYAVVQCTDRPVHMTVEDAVADFIDSIPFNIATRREPHADITRVSAAILESASVLAEAVDCDAQGTLCGTEEPSGEIVEVQVEVDGDIPATPDHALVYAFVARSDDDPANDWVARDPFAWDVFQGADFWLQRTQESSSDATLMATRVDADQTTQVVPTAARVTIGVRTIRFWIPLEELGGLPLEFRATAFAAGDLSFPETDRGGDVVGADPTEPLLELAAP